MKGMKFLILACAAATLCGCASNYAWRPSTPEEMRTVSVPTFRNESDVQEAGAVAARQLLREFQREGTFRIRATGDAALEVQGVVREGTSSTVAYDRRSGMRRSGSEFTLVAVVSVIDKRNGKVLIDNRAYSGVTTFTSGHDLATARRDAAGRAADDLARQVVDDILNFKWEK
jgi:hypothetical protein